MGGLRYTKKLRGYKIDGRMGEGKLNTRLEEKEGHRKWLKQAHTK